MSTVGSRTTSGTPAAFLSFWSATCDRPEVGDGGGHHDDVGTPSARPSTASAISAAVSTRTTSTPAATGRSTVVTSVTLAPRAAASSAMAWPCLPERAVGDEADRVDRLAGAAGGDEDLEAGEVAAAARRPRRGLDDRGGLGQAAGADVAAGEPADLGLDDVHAAAAQRRRGCPAPRRAPTSRCASPAPRAPGPGWRAARW